MADNEVGAALVGPFDRYLSEWDKMRRRTDIENRQNEQWPTVALPGDRSYLPQSVTLAEQVRRRVDASPEIPPIDSRLALEAGARDVAPLSKEEVLKFILNNEMTQPGPMPRRPGST